MKLATLRTGGTTRAVRLDGDVLTDLGVPDVGALLAEEGWAERAATATGTAHPVGGADFAPLVPAPSKVVCVGLNYRNHIQEMGRDLPEHPTLFAKFADSLIGAGDDIVRPDETAKFDWEVELALVVGGPRRRARGGRAQAGHARVDLQNNKTKPPKNR
ncbi:fumarylacetoacetate hydrolase family protein, partial [Streptomyces sp. NPDC003832]